VRKKRHSCLTPMFGILIACASIFGTACETLPQLTGEDVIAIVQVGWEFYQESQEARRQNRIEDAERADARTAALIALAERYLARTSNPEAEAKLEELKQAVNGEEES
jgi:hypothetical protein